MVPIIADSARARRHGVADEDMLHAFANPLTVSELEGFVMIVGGDTAARLIEVGFVDGETGPVIVHAMYPARAKFLR